MTQKPSVRPGGTVVAAAASQQPQAPGYIVGEIDADTAPNEALAWCTAPGSPVDTAASAVRITTDVDGSGVAVIGVVGELVMDTAGELLAAINAVLIAGPVTRVVVDLDRVSFLDMAALSVLLRGRAAAVQAGASFGAIRAQRLVRRVLHLTGTCQLLTMMYAKG